MLDVISVENMRRSDANTIASFVPSLELMWRASNGIFEEALKKNPAAFDGETVIVVGSGNNGGDGFGLAVVLKNKGYSSIRIVSVANHYTDDAAFYMEKASKLGIEVEKFASGTQQFLSANTIVDCLLGTGFVGEPRESYKNAIEEINCSAAYVISADINSGLNGDTGDAVIAVKADLVVTIGYYKTGILLARNSEYIKGIALAPIGIVLDKKENFLLSEKEWCEKGFDLSLDKVTSDGVIYFRGN